MISIIKATVKNIPEIQEIANKSWVVTYKSIISTQQIDYMLKTMYNTNVLIQQIENQNFEFYICVYSNTSIGFIAFEKNYQNSSKTKIHKLYILPNFQGKGIGKILINHSIKITLQNKNTALILNVNKQNSAKYFYKKLGFTISYQEVINIGNGFVMDDFVMELSI